MASYTGSDHHNYPFTSNYPHSLRTRGTSPYAPNRSASFNPNPALQRRPPLPESFQRMESPESQSSEQLIDTAIVIKNIPFGYPEEDFANKLFPQLGLVPPYAFNYHRNKNDRAFHGLAFANFNAPHEAQAAVDVLNNYELDRRRLRVELKKKLPAEEERQKLARQTRRQATDSTSQPTFPPMTQDIQTLPQPVEAMPMTVDILDPSLRPRIVYRGPPTPVPQTELDMNDLDTLGFYTTMQLFRNNPEMAGATLQFPTTLTPEQRRIVHSLAVRLDLEHCSHGVGQERFVTVTRRSTPPQPDLSYHPIPTTRASTEQLIQPPLSPRQHDLRTSRSLTSLRAERPPIPPFPAEMSLPYSHDLFASHRLAHRSSQESAVSSGNRSLVFGPSNLSHQPTRQPHGPSQDPSRGFEPRPSLTQIRPIGHGAKTPSRGSLSHGSGASRESRGGSDSILDLHVQSSISHQSQEYPTSRDVTM